jgi:ATP-dependent Clp protease protease subunit
MSRIKRDDISYFMDEGIYLPTRTLYMGSTGSENGEENGVDYLMAERVIKGLHILDSSVVDQGITILLNNIGGDVTHGLAIYDAIKHCKNHVTIKAYGHAMSMGSIILQAADDRLMAERAVMMLHVGNDSVSGHAINVERWVEWNKKVLKEDELLFLSKIKQAKPRFTRDMVRKMLEFDKILSAREALELGLIDGVINDEGEIERLPENQRRLNEQ